MAGDVAADGQQQAASVGAQGDALRLDPATATLESDDFELQFGRLAGKHARDMGSELFPVRRCNDVDHRLAGPLRQRVRLDQRQRGRVHLDQMTPFVEQHDALRPGLDDGAQACLTARQIRLGRRPIDPGPRQLPADRSQHREQQGCDDPETRPDLKRESVEPCRGQMGDGLPDVLARFDRAAARHEGLCRARTGFLADNERMNGLPGPQAVGDADLTAVLAAHALPGFGRADSQRQLGALEHEPPFVLRLRALQPVAIAVHQHHVTAHFRRRPCKFVKHVARGVVDDDDTALPSLAIRHRRRHTHHRLVGFRDLVVFDVEVERRNEYFTGSELHRVGEEIALALVLELCPRHDDRRTAHVVDAHDLHPGFVDPAQLSVDALAARESHENLGQMREVRRLRIVQGPARADAIDQVDEVAGDVLDLAGQHPSAEACVQRLAALQSRRLLFDFALANPRDPRQHQGRQREEGTQERQRHRVACGDPVEK